MNPLRIAGLIFNRLFSWHPRLSLGYLSLWAWVLSYLSDGNWLKAHIGNTLRGTAWPDIKLKPREIELAPGIEALLVPIPGSLGFRAIYEHRIRHEPGVPDFLAGRMAHYDAVLEVGANVGTYTLLFSRSLPRDGITRVFAYEPGPVPYACLKEHIRLNEAVNVEAFNCAVASVPGPLLFHDNAVDYMKGSLRPEIASLFPGSNPAGTPVTVVTGEQIAGLIDHFSRVLFKIDVMGSEPDVLTSLSTLVDKLSPDLVLGVWKYNVQGLNQLEFLRRNYAFYKIERDGLTARDRFGDDVYCNYFLEPTSRRHALAGEADRRRDPSDHV